MIPHLVKHLDWELTLLIECLTRGVSNGQAKTDLVPLDLSNASYESKE